MFPPKHNPTTKPQPKHSLPKETVPAILNTNYCAPCECMVSIAELTAHTLKTGTNYCDWPKVMLMTFLPLQTSGNLAGLIYFVILNLLQQSTSSVIHPWIQENTKFHSPMFHFIHVSVYYLLIQKLHAVCTHQHYTVAFLTSLLSAQAASENKSTKFHLIFFFMLSTYYLLRRSSYS